MRLSPMHSHSSPRVVSCHHRLRITDPERERHVLLSFLVPPNSIVGLFTRWVWTVGTTIENSPSEHMDCHVAVDFPSQTTIIPTTPRPLRLFPHIGDELLCRYKRSSLYSSPVARDERTRTQPPPPPPIIIRRGSTATQQRLQRPMGVVPCDRNDETGHHK
jgi:hypothetical protein